MASNQVRARKSTIIAGAVPLAILASLYLFAATVRLLMGGLPDPDSLIQPLRTWDIIATLPILLLYPLSLVAVLGLALSILPRFRCIRSGSTAFLLSAAFAIGVLAVDLGGIFAWIMD